MKLSDVDFVGGDFNMAVKGPMADVFSDAEFMVPGSSPDDLFASESLSLSLSLSLSPSLSLSLPCLRTLALCPLYLRV